MVEAGRLLSTQRDLWRGTLLLAFVADEEIDGGGSRALVKQEPKADLVVVGEPTNNAVFAAHKGCLRPLIRTNGKAAHSGRPELGVNAILAAGHLMTLFDARDRELEPRPIRSSATPASASRASPAGSPTMSCPTLARWFSTGACFLARLSTPHWTNCTPC